MRVTTYSQSTVSSFVSGTDGSSVTMAFIYTITLGVSKDTDGYLDLFYVLAPRRDRYCELCVSIPSYVEGTVSHTNVKE